MDGFDLGVGMLLPFVGRDDTERRVAINTVGPVWEGNQVWLILGGGAIFAAWPPLYAVAFSGFYLAMFLVLARSSCGRSASSIAPSGPIRAGASVLGLGAVHRRLRAGADFRRGRRQRAPGRALPLRRRPCASSTRAVFIGLLNPFALLCGPAVSVAMLVMHGGAWLA